MLSNNRENYDLWILWLKYLHYLDILIKIKIIRINVYFIEICITFIHSYNFVLNYQGNNSVNHFIASAADI